MGRHRLLFAAILFSSASASAQAGYGPPPSYRPGVQAPGAAFARLQATYNVASSIDRTPAVKIIAPQVVFRGLAGRNIHFGSRFRPQGGTWSDWVSSGSYTINADPYTWNSAYSYDVRYSTLRSHDTANGRFVVHEGAFDEQNREIGWAELPVEVAFGGAVGYGAPPPPAPTPVAYGPQPMSPQAFAGFYQALRNSMSDFSKKDMCASVLPRNWITAAQLGQILDLFMSDFSKMDVAKIAAPRMIDKQNALGLASKFVSTFSQRDFVALMSR
jgi:hypothetical protein